MIEAIFYFVEDCPICRRVRWILHSYEIRGKISLVSIDTETNPGATHMGWYRWFSEQVRKDVIPIVRLGVNGIFDRVVYVPKLGGPRAKGEPVTEEEIRSFERELGREIKDLERNPPTPLPQTHSIRFKGRFLKL